jgi:hydroxymethylglutaryl-CoA reductase
VKAAALSEGMYRAPVFIFKDVGDAIRFSRYLPELFTFFSESSERTSKHVKLLDIIPFVIGTSVHTRFRYRCGDAAGQNMVSIASHRACKDFIGSEKSTGLNIVDFLVEGQFSSDKKLSIGHITVPRGTEVMVWATITDQVARTVLGNSTKRLHEVFLLTTHACIRNGVQGNNINTANILAAFFIAGKFVLAIFDSRPRRLTVITAGQDPGSVGESSWSQLTTEFDDDSGDLTFSLYFPSLPVGTVGGGTGYPTQREALDLIGCRGTGRKWALAETVASFALALDISTLSAVCNDTFAQSHHRLARGGLARANVGLTPLARL